MLEATLYKRGFANDSWEADHEYENLSWQARQFK